MFSLLALSVVSVLLWRNGHKFSYGGLALALIVLVIGVVSGLFLFWSLYLLIRFALAFGKARKLLRRKWAAGDRAMESAAPAR